MWPVPNHPLLLQECGAQGCLVKRSPKKDNKDSAIQFHLDGNAVDSGHFNAWLFSLNIRRAFSIGFMCHISIHSGLQLQLYTG